MAEGLRVAHLTTVDMSLALLLGTELAVDVEEGFETFGISAPGPYVPAIEALGVRHVPVPALTRAWDLRADATAARHLRRILAQLRPDVLHTHNPKTGVLGRVLGRAVGISVVVNTCHGLWYRDGDPRAKRLAVLAAEAFAARWSHAELYQNDADRATLARVLPAGHGRTVGNGVDLARFRPDPRAAAAVRAELGIGSDEVLVGGVGRRVAEKGIREYAAVARRLGGRARFVWVGPDDAAKTDRMEHDERGVTFLGERRDMPAVYAALDVFVLPSYREGFSRSAMEAAACGCPLVLSDIRGCRELGTPGREVLFCPVGDVDALAAAVSRLLDDRALRERLGAAAAARAADAFDQRTVARASIDTYARVAARRGLRWDARRTWTAPTGRMP